MDSESSSSSSRRVAQKVFWFCLSVAFLAFAGSWAYFLLVYVPRHNAAREQKALELSRNEAETKAKLDCTNQAARALKKFIEENRMASSVLGEPPDVLGSTNHYNKLLSTCFLEIDYAADKDLHGFYLLDAYEGTQALYCVSKFGGTTSCLDADENPIDEQEATLRKKSFMGQ